MDTTVGKAMCLWRRCYSQFMSKNLRVLTLQQNVLTQHMSMQWVDTLKMNPATHNKIKFLNTKAYDLNQYGNAD